MVGDEAARHRVACPTRRAPPYLPRRPQASPLYRVLVDHFETLERVHEERFEPMHGPLRRVARAAVGAGVAARGARATRRAGARVGGGFLVERGARTCVDSARRAYRFLFLAAS